MKRDDLWRIVPNRQDRNTLKQNKKSMKHLISISFFLLVGLTLVAQQKHIEITSTGDAPHLLGKIDKTRLTSNHHNSWFTPNFENYGVDKSLISKIAPNLKNYNIKLFMGTWCGDSKQEVPKFYKILEACNFPMEQLTVIAVSREADFYKQSPQHEEKGLNIHRVPTFIFYKDGTEINRIVEHPVETFEKDMLNIITTNDYKSNYQIVAVFDSILETSGVKGLRKQKKQLLRTYDGKIQSYGELNTYGRILYGTDKLDEAIAVLKLNNTLFPNNPRTYVNLANTLGVKGNSKKAIKIIKKAIKKFPENQDLIKSLEALKSKLQKNFFAIYIQ